MKRYVLPSLLFLGMNAFAQSGDTSGTSETPTWEAAGFSAEEAEKWASQGFEPEAAEEWKQSGFDPDSANSWWEAGFEQLPDAAAEWRATGLPSEQAYQAYYVGLKAESMKEWPAGVPITYAAIGKDNNLSPKAMIASVKKLVTTQNMAAAKDGYELNDFNPYEVTGKLFSLDAERLQLLGKSVGIYSLIDDPSQHVYLDFRGKIAPNGKVFLLGKGAKPFEYTSVAGAKSIIPSLSVIGHYKILNETWEKLEALNLVGQSSQPTPEDSIPSDE